MRVRHVARKLKAQLAPYVKRAWSNSKPTMGNCASEETGQLSRPELGWRAPESSAKLPIEAMAAEPGRGDR